MQKEPGLLRNQRKTQRDNTQKDPDYISKKQSRIITTRKSARDYKGTISVIKIPKIITINSNQNTNDTNNRIKCRGGEYLSVFALDIQDLTVKIEPKHTKAIVRGKLYDTEKSTEICLMPNNRLLFVTKKGNFFSCDRRRDDYSYTDKRGVHSVSESFYCDIRPETVESVKDIIGASDPSKYIELFREAEEA